MPLPESRFVRAVAFVVYSAAFPGLPSLLARLPGAMVRTSEIMMNPASGLKSTTPTRRARAGALFVFATACVAGLLVLSISRPIAAGPPNVKGKVSGAERLVADVYLEAAKPESRRWNWREPSPAVPPQFRALAPNISREVCVVAFTSGKNPPLPSPVLVRLTGGRTNPATLVVTPGSSLVFENEDPFAHRLVIVGQTAWRGTLEARAKREWKAPDGAAVVEFRDELFPSVRSFVVVDPGAVQSVYPTRDGSFAFALPPGQYVLKAFFGGKQVGKEMGAEAKDRVTLELKDALAVTEAVK